MSFVTANAAILKSDFGQVTPVSSFMSFLEDRVLLMV